SVVFAGEVLTLRRACVQLSQRQPRLARVLGKSDGHPGDARHQDLAIRRRADLGLTYALSVARYSARRSYDSEAPVSMPLCSMPSRSSTESKRDVTVNLVRPPRSSSTIVSTEMRPGRPSHSNVCTARSGGVSSRYSPR